MQYIGDICELGKTTVSSQLDSELVADLYLSLRHSPAAALKSGTNTSNTAVSTAMALETEWLVCRLK